MNYMDLIFMKQVFIFFVSSGNNQKFLIIFNFKYKHFELKLYLQSCIDYI